MVNLEKIIEDTAVKMLQLAVTELPPDVMNALKKARERETNERAKKILDTLIMNAEIAKEKRLPICQDTGLVNWYVEIGEDFPIKAKLAEILRKATIRATKEVPLRPNAIDPIIEKNSGNNTGPNVPQIVWELVPGDELHLTVLPKGGGSEYWCRLYTIRPIEGLNGVIRCALQTLKDAMGKPCPPVIVGIGIGGTTDLAMKLAKKAILRSLDDSHSNPKVAELEKKIFELANKLGIGPMGLGGDTTCLGVKIEVAARHPACYPVAIAIQCWAARRCSVIITKDGTVKFLTHKI